MKSNRLLSVLFVCCASAVALAQSPNGQTIPAAPSPEAIVFFDFTGANPSSRVIISSSDKTWKKLHTLIKEITEGKVGTEVEPDVIPVSTSDSKLNELLKIFSMKVGEPPLRVITKKGEEIEVLALVPAGRTVVLDAKEESRDTVLSEGLRILKGTLNGSVKGMAAARGKDSYLLHKIFTLDMVRANLLVTAKQPVTEDLAKEATKVEVPLVTGPAEHFFLGATINLKNVKYADGGVKPTEKPNHLNVGLYFQPFGDVLSNYDVLNNPSDSLSKLLVVQASVELSSKPFNSRSWGVGVKVPKLSGGLKFLSGLSITRGVIRTEGERFVGTTTEKFHQSDWMWMVGYDLLQVKEWFTK